MTRQTSIDAYNIIKANGLLSRRRFQVYECIIKYGPMTGSEISKKIDPMIQKSLTPRLSELLAQTVIYKVRERKCTVTGFNVTEWGATNNLPVKLEKPKRTKCKHCNGNGYIEDKQMRML